MSPRKKSKPNPLAEHAGASASPVPPDSTAPAATPAATTPSGSTTLENAPASSAMQGSLDSSNGAATPSTPAEPQLNTKPSKRWLSGGSWRSKASATVKTASQSIGVSVSGGAPSDIPAEEPKTSKDQSPAKFLMKRKSSKADTIPASLTTLNVSSDGSVNEPKEPTPEETPKEPPTVNEPPLPPDPPKIDAAQQAGTWGWTSWWSRPDGYSEASKTPAIEDAQGTPLPGVTPSEEPTAAAKQLGSVTAHEQPSKEQDVEMKDVPAEDVHEPQDTEMKDRDTSTTSAPAPRNSWFWSWSSKESVPADPPATTTAPPEYVPDASNEEILLPQAAEAPQTEPTSQVEETAGDAVASEAAPDADKKGRSNSQGWAFWFKSQSKAEVNSDGAVAHKLVGEVAVSDTPSQSHPEPAQFNELEQPKPDDSKPAEEPKAKSPTSSGRSFLSLRGRSRAKTVPKEISTDTPSSSKTVTPSKTSPDPSPTRPGTAPAAEPAAKEAPKAKEEPPNILLPEFHTTYRMVQQPSFWQKVTQYFLGNEAPQPHLHINPAPPRIKKAVAIGVHGFFPNSYVRKVIGEPKGTSIRFATAAAASIKGWCEERGYEPEIDHIALEGEGFIADRVRTLWTLLLNSVDVIRKADFILVACHSQGVPVAVMLVAKLIQSGFINSARIGICAMAGVNMGPFVDFKSKAGIFGSIASELFSFGDPKSLASQMYLAALDEVLRFGVRVTYVGSIDDQLVSLESSIFSVVSHPYIYRAVFVDGRNHAPSFLTHLVGFVLKLRNLGLPDHGLIRELSPHLAGSVYGGEGHSRVYEDPRVYTLAIQHSLETTSLPVSPQQVKANVAATFGGINIPVPGAKYNAKDTYKLRVKEYKSSGSAAGENPYFLPWAMRGLLEEELVKKELGKEVDGLLNMFEEWKPTDKRLKDVKFRLEGVRSKL
ncbi:uncharacterized protein CC84DRAFT_1111120 [Paraphaeosphaeria sporulosa]|uniref:YMC020W-like alpha/beta hydrolase domain-containing protein n=1 Tax=Paraphaeosphaeria sporulosa TaxID=1460663 RepID=A0A177CRM4_9PLEO|nr:uncharacterized protein CC84DRAFT_1111120 [Paraphaeosphaeria sporulosa]OAG09592.1 hypothetical protein CC84DRAFT_1111120 [Paraphaeosphaeria sporulosa]